MDLSAVPKRASLFGTSNDTSQARRKWREADLVLPVKMEQPYYTNEILIVMPGDILQGWREVGTTHSLPSDIDIACFLVEHYKKTKDGGNAAQVCVNCKTPLNFICSSCGLSDPQISATELVPLIGNGSANDVLDVHFDADDVGPANEAADEVDVIVSRSEYQTGKSTENNAVEKNVEKSQLKTSVLSYSQLTSQVAGKLPAFCGDVSRETTESDLEKKTASSTNAGKAAAQKFAFRQDNSANTSSNSNIPSKVKVSSNAKRNADSNVKRKIGRPKKNTACEECGAEFPTSSALREHQQKLKHGTVKTKGGRKGRDYECDLCSASFSTLYRFKDHYRVQHKLKLHQCEQCSASFSNQQNLIAHNRRHTGERPFRCDQCDKAFSRNNTLVQHMRIHTNERPYGCDQCDEAFKQRGALIIHKRKHTGEMPFKCTICSAAFIAMGRLTAHMVSHTGARPFLCDECGASFSSKGALKAHTMTHIGLRPFSCDECDKRFYRNTDLRAHKRTHTGQRDIVCVVCGQAFLAASNYRRHMQKHTGYRPHLCVECGKYFASKSELKVHTRIHTGDKPYLCPDCDRSFITRGNMMKHWNNRHRPKARPGSTSAVMQMFDTSKRFNPHVHAATSTVYSTSDSMHRGVYSETDHLDSETLQQIGEAGPSSVTGVSMKIFNAVKRYSNVPIEPNNDSLEQSSDSATQ